MQDFAGRLWLGDWFCETSKPYPVWSLKILGTPSNSLIQPSYSNYTTGAERRNFEQHGTKLIANPKRHRQYQLVQLQSGYQRQHRDIRRG